MGSPIFASVPMTLWTWAKSRTKGPVAVGILGLGSQVHERAGTPMTTPGGSPPELSHSQKVTRTHPGETPSPCILRRSHLCLPKPLSPTPLAHDPGTPGEAGPRLEPHWVWKLVSLTPI